MNITITKNILKLIKLLNILNIKNYIILYLYANIYYQNMRNTFKSTIFANARNLEKKDFNLNALIIEINI